MTVNEQTYQQIERALRKVASKYPTDVEFPPLTDLHLQVLQDSGELRIFDDDDHEITRCVVEIKRIKDVTENIAIIKPYSFTLIGEDHETIADLYLVDDDTILISGDLMKGLGEDLENFWQELEHQD